MNQQYLQSIIDSITRQQQQHAVSTETADTAEAVNRNYGVMDYPLLQQGDFALTPFNLLIFAILFLLGKLAISFLSRYFKAKQLQQVKIEGREIAVWKLVKQFIWLIIIYIGFLSLRLNNSQLNITDILKFEFVRFDTFHIAVYHIFIIIAVVFITRICLNFLQVWLSRTANKNNLDKGTEYVYIQLAKYFVYAIAAIVIIRSCGIDLDLFLTATAFLLVGVGLGLQHIFSHYFSGLLLLFEGSVKVGDIVEVQNLSGQENFIAKIVSINLRTSKIETWDGKVLIVPNSKLTHESVNNWSYGSQLTRFMIPVTVKYGTDVDLVCEILKRCAEAHPHVTDQRQVMVRLLNFGKDGYELDVVFWAEQNFFIEIHKSEIRFAIDREFRKYGIVIPHKQVELHQPAGDQTN
jgi:small-conductance mechanosensitive channel